MKIINNTEAEERWNVGDVIEYFNGYGETKRYGLIVSKTGFVADDHSQSGFSIINLDGKSAGFLAYSDSGNAKWFYDVKQLQTVFKKNWSHAKKVPFYGVVGKPEED